MRIDASKITVYIASGVACAVTLGVADLFFKIFHMILFHVTGGVIR